MDAGSILGVPAVRPAFLDDLSTACPTEAESRRGADDMTNCGPGHDYSEGTRPWRADNDDEDDVDDDFDDEFGDEDDEDDEDEEDENPEDPETWQVFDGLKLR